LSNLNLIIWLYQELLILGGITMEIQIRNVNTDDIEMWIELLQEYDVYVNELVGD